MRIIHQNGGKYKRVFYQGEDKEWEQGDTKTLVDVSGAGKLASIYCYIKGTSNLSRSSYYDIYVDNESIKHLMPGFNPPKDPHIHMDWIHGHDALHFSVVFAELSTPFSVGSGTAVVTHHDGNKHVWGYGACSGPIVDQYFESSLKITITSMDPGISTIRWSVCVDHEIEKSKGNKYRHDMYYVHGHSENPNLVISPRKILTLSTGTIGHGEVVGLAFYCGFPYPLFRDVKNVAALIYRHRTSLREILSLSLRKNEWYKWSEDAPITLHVDKSEDPILRMRPDMPGGILIPSGKAILSDKLCATSHKSGLYICWGLLDLNVPIEEQFDIIIKNNSGIPISISHVAVFVKKRLK